MYKSYEAPQIHGKEAPRRSPKESFKYLDSLLHKVSGEISDELKDKYGIEGLIGQDCSIRMEAFKELNPAIYEKDKEKVERKEEEWSGVKNEGTRKFYCEKYGLAEDISDGEIVERHLEEMSKEKPKQLEMMITILLHKAFGDGYFVVRSAKNDDYFGGIDNVIVNKETGDVICAFDEVRENSRSNRRNEKDEKVTARARSGGAELIYGFTVLEGKVKLRSMGNLPLFCLGLDGDEYDELANAIEYNGNSDLNEVEQRFLDKILASIEEQKVRLLSDPSVQRNKAVVDNLNKVSELTGRR